MGFFFFAQTLKTQCCSVCSSEGVNLSATSGYACQNPSPPPYLCPVLQIIPASDSLICFNVHRHFHYYVLSVVMMSTMHPSLNLIVFLKCLYRPSWFAVFLSRRYKSMLKKRKQMTNQTGGERKTKRHNERRATGPSLMQSVYLVPDHFLL